MPTKCPKCKSRTTVVNGFWYCVRNPFIIGLGHRSRCDAYGKVA